MNENKTTNMTAEEAAALVRKSTGATEVKTTDRINNTDTMRKLLIVGTGDGGCNIASAIRQAVPSCLAITYNTSNKGMDNIKTDMMIIPNAEDGSGKERSYSQEVFKAKPYDNLLRGAQELDDKYDLDYVIVTSTADGGTGGGVSPMVAKLLSDNLDVPVIILGVYPAISEDAVAQQNAILWQKDVEKTKLPYMIFDNEGPNKLEMHAAVNASVVQAVRIIAGEPFGETNLSSIDNRDMYMLLSHLGGRIVVASSYARPSVNQSLDSYLISMLNPTNTHQPLPANLRGIGLFLKGPKSFLDTVNTSLSGICEHYGEAALKYTHMEESDSFMLAIIMSGNMEPANRIMIMRQRYDEICAGMKSESDSVLDNALGGMDNLIGTPRKKTRPAEADLSALDL